MNRAATVVPTLIVAVLISAGCKSAWFEDKSYTDLVVTDLIVRTSPAGAAVEIGGEERGKSPLKMPVQYPHTMTTYQRQTNVGQSLRDSWGTIGTIIGFPIWIPASLFHTTEERRLHEYGSNKFEVSAYLAGHDEKWQDVELQGEDTFEVDLTLPPSR